MDGLELQVTSPRIPCSVFAARMGDLHWVKNFRDAARPGLYCRVLNEGSLATGARVSVERYRGDTVSIHEMFLFHYQKEKSADQIRKYLDAPIDLRSRRGLEEKLAGLARHG
jgi:MOSC domain-containing protein YiiM